MNKSRWNRSRTYRQSKSLKQAYRIGDLVVYHWTQRYDGGSPDDELCVVTEVRGECLSLQPVNGDCAFPASKAEVSHVA